MHAFSEDCSRILIRLARVFAAGLICLTLVGCASGSSVSSKEILDAVKNSPIRPYFARQTLRGDPANSIRYYGIQFQKRL